MDEIWVYQSVFPSPVLEDEPPEAITVDKWFRPLDEPVFLAPEDDEDFYTFHYPFQAQVLDPGSTFDNEPIESTFDPAPSCGGKGLYNFPTVNEIRTTNPNAPVTVAQLNTALKNVRAALDKLANKSLVDLFDPNTRISTMPVAVSVVSVQDDSVTATTSDGYEITVAKPPHLRVSDHPELAGVPTYTVGQVIYVERVAGGGAPNGGLGGFTFGAGTGVTNVYYIDTNMQGQTAEGAQGFTGTKTVVTNVACVADELVLTTEQVTYVNGVVTNIE